MRDCTRRYGNSSKEILKKKFKEKAAHGAAIVAVKSQSERQAGEEDPLK